MTTQTLRRIGPAGVLVWDGDPLTQRAEWLAARRLGIGSSDIPRIAGYSPYGTAVDVWAMKTGRQAEDDGGSEAAVWGQLLEGVVADEWARRNKVEVTSLGIVANADQQWQRASLDRLVHGCMAGNCFLEVKTRSSWATEYWQVGVPDDVLAQIQWDFVVTGFDHGHVACLIGGQQLLSHVVMPEPKVMNMLRRQATELWADIQANRTPTVEAERRKPAFVHALDEQFPVQPGVLDVPAAKATAFLADYRVALADEKEAKGRKEAAGAELALLLGDREEARIDGHTAYTRREYEKTSTDLDALRDGWPDAYAACCTTTTHRRLNISGDYR